MRKLLQMGAVMMAAMSGPAWADMVSDCVNDAKDYPRAVRACTDAIKSGDWSGPDLAWAYTNRGLAHYEMGEYLKAISDYDQSIRLKPSHYDAHFGKGATYCEMGRPDQAVEWYSQAIRGGSWNAYDVQTYLRDQGFYTGSISGFFDANTQRALGRWADNHCR